MALASAKRCSCLMSVVLCLQALVEYYQTNTLNTNFPGLTTVLAKPFNSTTGKCVAQYDFQARDQDELTIEVRHTPFTSFYAHAYISCEKSGIGIQLGVEIHTLDSYITYMYVDISWSATTLFCKNCWISWKAEKHSMFKKKKRTHRGTCSSSDEKKACLLVDHAGGFPLACRQETGSLFVNGILQSFVLSLAEKKVFLCRALFSLVSDVNILLG